MEKQPIDDLFHRKLRDAEVMPGADVFGRLQSRLNTTPLPVEVPKRRLAGWWYGAAAACLLLTLAWAYSWRNVFNNAPGRNADKLTQRVTPIPKAKEPGGQPVIGVKKANPTPAAVASEQPARTQLASTETGGFTSEPMGETDQRAQQMHLRQQAQPIKDQLKAVSEAVVHQGPEERLAMPRTTDTNPVAPAPGRQPTPERVVMMTIDLSDKTDAVVTEAVAKAPTQPIATPQPSLSQLVAKVKQLKNGELLARATSPRPAAEPRTGLGRLFSGVKESLRNENTLEP